MQKKGLFFIVIFSLFSSFVLFLPIDVLAAGEKTAFSGTVEQGEIMVDNNPAQIAIVTGKVRVKYLDRIIIVQEGRCEEDTGVTVCASGIVPGMSATVTIKLAMADITIEKIVTGKDFGINALAPVKVILSNNGKLAATNVKFKDDIKGLTIINPTGCTIDVDYLIYNRYISAGSSKFCEYKVKITGDGPFYRAATVEYFNGLEETSASASATITTIPYGFKINSNLETEKLDLGKENNVWFNFTLKSTKTTDARSLVIQFPNGVKVTDLKGNELAANKFSWSGFVDPKQSKFFEFKVTALNLNPDEVNTLVNFVSDQSGAENKNFKLNLNYIEPLITFKDVNLSVLEGTNTIYLKNDNGFDLENVRVKISSTGFGFDKRDFDVGNVPAKNEAKVGEFSFREAKSGISKVFVDVSFKIHNGGDIKFTKIIDFNVNASAGFKQNAEKKLDNSKINETIEIGKKDDKASEKKPLFREFLCRSFGWLISSFC